VFLARDQLRAMTGYHRPSAIRSWLARNGYRFDVRADGWPVVAEAQVLKRQGLTAPKVQEPDLSVLD